MIDETLTTHGPDEVGRLCSGGASGGLSIPGVGLPQGEQLLFRQPQHIALHLRLCCHLGVAHRAAAQLQQSGSPSSVRLACQLCSNEVVFPPIMTPAARQVGATACLLHICKLQGMKQYC